MLSRQLQAAQSSTAALGAEAAELRAEVCARTLTHIDVACAARCPRLAKACQKCVQSAGRGAAGSRTCAELSVAR